MNRWTINMHVVSDVAACVNNLRWCNLENRIDFVCCTSTTNSALQTQNAILYVKFWGRIQSMMPHVVDGVENSGKGVRFSQILLWFGRLLLFGGKQIFSLTLDYARENISDPDMLELFETYLSEISRKTAVSLEFFQKVGLLDFLSNCCKINRTEESLLVHLSFSNTKMSPS